MILTHVGRNKLRLGYEKVPVNGNTKSGQLLVSGAVIIIALDWFMCGMYYSHGPATLPRTTSVHETKDEVIATFPIYLSA